MSKGFYRQLAKTNMKKNGKIYTPYILSVIAAVAMFYIIQSLALNPGFENMLGFDTMNSILIFACWVVRIFLVIFMLYTNSFLIKQRRKEFGVYHMLGLEKKHLAITLFWESLSVLVIGLLAGILFGMLLDKLLYAVLIRMLGFSVPLGFFVSPLAIGRTVALFVVIMALNYFYDIAQIHATSPIELLHGTDMGEKEPRAKWLLAILGFILLATGYTISLKIEDPVSALAFFFVAVLCVIFGTYLLFTAGSIALLKLLKKKKSFYYKTNHFVSVSGMMYRMKQNAIGLAHICVLSTMVLVMISTTSSMMFSMHDILYTRYPMQNMCYVSGTSRSDDQKMIEDIHQMAKETGCDVKDEIYARGCIIYTRRHGDAFEADATAMGTSAGVLFCMNLEDYNKSMHTKETLEPGEVLVYAAHERYGKDTIEIMGQDYRVKEVKKAPCNGILASYMSSGYYIVFPDEAAVEQIAEHIPYQYDDCFNELRSYYGIDIDGDADQQKELYKKIQTYPSTNMSSFSVENRNVNEKSLNALYGGLFFTGAFLGVLFLIATVLIIYYKQMSEGYDDRKRFHIMQQVGMTHEEVSSAIRSQVLMVFFMPLVAACIHTCFAFPIICRMLSLFNMRNTTLLVACMIGCFVVFGIIYVLVYLMTARTYNRIVQE